MKVRERAVRSICNLCRARACPLEVVAEVSQDSKKEEIPNERINQKPSFPKLKVSVKQFFPTCDSPKGQPKSQKAQGSLILWS